MTEPSPSPHAENRSTATSFGESLRSRSLWDADRRLVVLVLLASVLRFFRLGSESLWTDELITWGFVARNSTVELLWVIPTSQPHLPLYYVILDAWSLVFGFGEAALRFPAAAFGVVSVALCYVLAAHLFDRNAGFVAGLLLATSQFHIQHSQEVRMYTLFTMLALASTYLFVLLRQGRTRRFAVAYVVATMALIGTHPFAVFVPLAHAVFLFADRVESGTKSARSVREAMGATWLVAGPVLLVLLWKLSDTRFDYITPPSPRHVVNTVAIVVGFEGLTTVLIVLGLALVSALASLALFREFAGESTRRGFDGRFGPAVFVAICAATPFVANLLVSVTLTPMFWPRYVIAGGPALFILVGAGASGLSESVRPSAAILAILVVLALFAQPTAALYTTTEREQWREAGAVVEANAEPGDRILVVDAISEEGMQHYVDREGVTVEGVFVEDSGTGNDPDTAAEIREKAGTGDRVWVATSHVSDSEEKRVLGVLEANRTLVESWSFVGVDLYLFEREDEGSEAAEVRPPARSEMQSVRSLSG